MAITRDQAEDLLAENYSDLLQFDDPDWWEDMVAALMRYPSVKRLRHPTDASDRFGGSHWRVPRHWPGADPKAKESQSRD